MRKWSLASRLLIGQLAFLVCLSLGLSLALYLQAERDSYEETGDRMLAVAGTVAADPFVLESAAAADPSSSLQPFARAVMDAAHIDFLTIMAPDRTRFTHRSEDEIGKAYLGSVDQALDGQSFTETYAGTLGPSVRAIVPVLGPDGEVTALVAAGITVDRVAVARNAQLPAVVLTSLGALVCGTLASYLLSRYLRRTTQDRRPDELQSMFTFYDSALHSLREGLLLLNNDGELVLYNDQAAELLGLEPGGSGRPRDTRALGLPGPLAALLHEGRTAEDEFHFARDRILVVNQSPALAPPGPDGVGRLRPLSRSAKRAAPAARRFGTVTTLRDHTDIEALTGELQSMRTLTDALQAQAHEHANRLHTLVSLIELNRHGDALDFATRDLERSQQLADDVVAAVGEPALAALLTGKSAQARERGIRLAVDLTHAGSDVPLELDPGELVTIVGNLIDNAFDAVQGLPDAAVDTRFALAGDHSRDWFEITVQDNGPGIPELVSGRVFDQGFSTKDPLVLLPSGTGATGRGIGLPLVRQAVLRLGGTLRLDPGGQPGCGAAFTVLLPLPGPDGLSPSAAPLSNAAAVQR
ncbi:ATP-binding protein [Arthrobacter sp. zg-Y820]|uniref:sensor histidine kinase n=1 Tax=unclassified Arthrobacter TaxID=235627 RepID=UPI001E2A0EEE|nr:MULTISPECIES: ATP-binding protein [unclassified Arthrobacter]MCC9197920.1 PAS domain-containing protein [Arthrobacter sp. zg-Y820]MDK1280787.1 ATP-binding protein [Arthrobacter sp. zg.Y820]MDK1360871.1 ATP-binding protein [Arthrobacter sp. zg-Y1219]WIB10589.1 ATP-binding protein [Arthrobacter sp. zg-Y820]